MSGERPDSMADVFDEWFQALGEEERAEIERSAGVVIDYDTAGRVVGIDIDSARHKVDLTRVVLNRVPGTVEQEVTQCE